LERETKRGKETLKLLNDLKLQFKKELWGLNPELAVMDSIINKHPKIIERVKEEVTGGGEEKVLGRKDMPTVEQVVRAGIYKEINNLTYRELEYQQYDSGLCELLIKLDERKPFSYKVFQKYISLISGDTLNRMMVAINRIAMGEGMEDGRSVRSDSTVIETNIHYPTNNSLIWDCIKTINRLLKKLKDSGVEIKVRSYKKQLKLLRSSMNQVERVLVAAQPYSIGAEV
jgi:IS5 family transposase